MSPDAASRVLGLVALLALAVAPAHAAAPDLFGPAPQTALAADALQQRGTLRARAASLRTDVVDGLFRPGATPVVSLNLFDDAVIGAARDRVETILDTLAWVGHATDDRLGTIVLVRGKDGHLSGSVSGVRGSFAIDPTADPAVVLIREVDTGAFSEEDDVRLPPRAPSADPIPPQAGDDGNTVDLLVVYTAAARTRAGSQANMEARAALGVAETNAAYANSGVVQRLRLVGTQEVVYTENNDQRLDLDNLTSTNNLVPGVHAARETFKADLVKLVTHPPAAPFCGVAWLLSGTNSAFGYSVTEYDCISPNYTFGHELGHNMGLKHARVDDGAAPGDLFYNYGFKDPEAEFRTVMAYNCSPSCPRVLQFSNPGINYQTFGPTGVPVAQPLAAFNAQRLNETRVTVANFRQAPVVGPPTTGPRLVWRDTISSGNVGFWFMNGVVMQSSNPLTPSPYPALTWEIQAMGDFNADGQPDLVWRDQGGSGLVVVWFMNGPTKLNGVAVSGTGFPPPSWRIVGAGDFNNDGKTDLVWRDQGNSGAVAIWHMNGTQKSGGVLVEGSRPALNWQIQGVGDFNADTKPDLVWRDQGSTGTVVIWHMDGALKLGGTAVTPAPYPVLTWQIQAVRDLNGDTKPDLVWRDQLGSGHVAVWYMSGATGTTKSSAVLANPSPVPNLNVRMVGAGTHTPAIEPGKDVPSSR